MASYDDELLEAAQLLIQRPRGKRGRLPTARIRRSLSTSYYALFHFLLGEVGTRIVGAPNDLRRRRRVLARTLTHSGIKTALDKVRTAIAEPSVADLLRSAAAGADEAPVPLFVQNLAKAFSDAQAKRHDADYNLNESLSETDAKVLQNRVRRVISGWRSATTKSDRDFKHALCILLLLKGQLRRDN